MFLFFSFCLFLGLAENKQKEKDDIKAKLATKTTVFPN